MKRVLRLLREWTPAVTWKSRITAMEEEIAGLRHRLKMDQRGPEGVKTLQVSELDKIFGYLDKINRGETGKEERAEELLNRYFERYLEPRQKEVYGYEYEGGITKRVVLPDPDIQYGILRKIWLIKIFETGDMARLEESVDFPNRLDKGRIGRYFFEERAMGPDLFELFLILNAIGGEFSSRIREALITKAVDDVAYFQTHFTKVPLHLVERSSCESKLVETFRDYVDGVTEGILINIGRRLDNASEVFFRDAGLWNTRVSYQSVLEGLNRSGLFNNEAERYRNGAIGDGEVTGLIIDQVKEGKLSIDAVVGAYVNNVYQSDFSTVNRKTFQCDDLVHIVESPVSGLSLGEIKEREKLFLESVGDKEVSDRELRSFYRHVRLWSLYVKGRIPRKYGDHKDFHLSWAYNSLSRYTGSKDAGKPYGLNDLVCLLKRNKGLVIQASS